MTADRLREINTKKKRESAFPGENGAGKKGSARREGEGNRRPQRKEKTGCRSDRTCSRVTSNNYFIGLRKKAVLTAE